MPAGISTEPMCPTVAGVLIAQPVAVSAMTSARPRLRNLVRKEFIENKRSFMYGNTGAGRSSAVFGCAARI